MAEDKNKPNSQERTSVEYGAPPKAVWDKKDGPASKDTPAPKDKS